jgi:sugar lactone lactonase YvrE
MAGGGWNQIMVHKQRIRSDASSLSGPSRRHSRMTRSACLLVAVIGLIVVSSSQGFAVTDTATISLVAGNGTAGLTGNKGPALAAELNGPCGLALDPHGNVVFSDTNNNVIRVLAESTGTDYGQSMTTGDVYGIAGDGVSGLRGNGVKPLKAQLSSPDGITVDSAGDVVIADTGNAIVRYIPATTATHFGIAMTAGDLYTVAGDGNYGFSGAGGPALKAEMGLDVVAGVVVDHNGNLVITDGDNNVIWLVANSTGTFYGQAMAAGDIYIIAGNGNADYTGDGGPAVAAALDEPEGVQVDTSGNIVFVDDSNDVIRVIAAQKGKFYGKKMTGGDIYTVGPKTDSNVLNTPEGLTIDAQGNLVFADAGNNVVYLLAAASGTDDGLTVKAGHLYTIAGTGTAGDTGDGGSPLKAELNSPCAVATDAHGHLVVADGGNNVIRQISS